MSRNDVVIYSHGLCCTSVCAAAELTPEEVAQAVNFQTPTGIASPWSVSEDTFANGAPNPNPCNDNPHRRHWLLTC